MIPLRLLFRSRWAALAWAASICWTAVHFARENAGEQAEAANGTAANAAQPVANGFDFPG